MKKIIFYIFCFIILFVINSCDYSTETKLEIINQSSYDLHIKFETGKLSVYKNEYDEIEVKKGQSVVIFLTDFGPPTPRNPNEEVEKIIFYNLDNNEIIKEVINNNILNEIFYNNKIFTGFTQQNTAYYQLIINNDLLK
jgi:hypothetical protein